MVHRNIRLAVHSGPAFVTNRVLSMFFGGRRGSWRIWLVIGLGLCLYAYHDWSTLHVPSDEELALSVETQYREEVARLQAHAGETPVYLNKEWQDKFRDAIRNEHLAPVAKAKKRIQSTVGLGLIVIVLALGMFFSARVTEKQNHSSGN